MQVIRMAFVGKSSCQICQKVPRNAGTIRGGHLKENIDVKSVKKYREMQVLYM